MGKLEREVKIRTRNSKITRAILTTLVIAVAGALNPQGLIRGVMRELKQKKEKGASSENSVYIARKRLLRQNLIEYNEDFFRITEKGKQLLRTSEGEYKPIPKPRKWDKKWRILIFDIREERKGLREKVRRTLISLGFKRLQDSVWVFPYDCEDLIVLLKADFRIGKDLLYIIADTIENDSFLKQEFGIK